MKKEFAAPEMLVEELEIEDIVTSSTEDDETGEGGTEVVNPFA